MRKAYLVDKEIDPSTLPFVFDGDRVIYNYYDGYVEVDGYLPDGNEVPLREQPQQ